MTHAQGDNSTFSLVGYTSMPEVTVNKKSGNVVFGGRLAIHTGNTTTKYIPVDISMETVNKTSRLLASSNTTYIMTVSTSS